MPAAPREHSSDTGAEVLSGGAKAGTRRRWEGEIVERPHRGQGPAAAACTSLADCNKKPLSLRSETTHTSSDNYPLTEHFERSSCHLWFARARPVNANTAWVRIQCTATLWPPLDHSCRLATHNCGLLFTCRPGSGVGTNNSGGGVVRFNQSTQALAKMAAQQTANQELGTVRYAFCRHFFRFE